MRYLDKESVDELEDLVASGSNESDGRLVTVVADQSGNYSTVHLLVAIAILFVGPIATAALVGVDPSSNFFLGQVVFLLGIFLTLSWTKAGIELIPASIRNRFCREKATSYFIDKELYRASAGGGVLIYVSVAEDYIDVIADDEISEFVSEDIWDDIRSHAVAQMKSGEHKASISFAVEACQAVLNEFYPSKGERGEARPSELVTVEA